MKYTRYRRLSFPDYGLVFIKGLSIWKPDISSMLNGSDKIQLHFHKAVMLIRFFCMIVKHSRS